MERCNVAVADEDFRICADGPVIQESHESGTAVAAAHAKNRVYFAVGEHPHEVARAFTVRAGQKTPALADVGSEFDFEPEVFKDFDGAVYRLRVRWRAGRRDEGDGVAATKAGWFYRRGHRFRILILILIGFVTAVRLRLRSGLSLRLGSSVISQRQKVSPGLGEGVLEVLKQGGSAIHPSGTAQFFEFLGEFDDLPGAEV